VPSGTIALHTIPKRNRHGPPAPAPSSSSSSARHRPSSSKPSKRAVAFESSDDADEADAGGAGVSAEELFAGAGWLSGDAAPSSFASAPVAGDADAAAAAADAAVAAADAADAAGLVCSDDDTSGEGDIVLDAGLRVRRVLNTHRISVYTISGSPHVVVCVAAVSAHWFAVAVGASLQRPRGNSRG
jgi:hypothetical protein